MHNNTNYMCVYFIFGLPRIGFAFLRLLKILEMAYTFLNQRSPISVSCNGLQYMCCAFYPCFKFSFLLFELHYLTNYKPSIKQKPNISTL